MIELRLYEAIFTMSLAEFCDVIGVRNVGKTTKMKVQPYELKSIFPSLCSISHLVLSSSNHGEGFFTSVS